MTTFNDMVDEVLLNLAGYTMRQDRLTYLTNAITSTTALSATIASVDNVARGLVEIDEELIFVDSVNRPSSSLTIAPFGRGYQGTAAATHAINTKVTIAPTFPRIAVKRALNDTVKAVYPQLWGIGTHTFSYSPAQSTYALPSDAEGVIAVAFSTTGPTKEWMPIRSYRHDPMANTASFTSGNTITLYSGVEPGRTVQVTYSKEATAMVNNSDSFVGVTGLPLSTKDVIIYGAAYRLISFIDPSRLTFTSAEADEADRTKPIGVGSNAARFIFSLYQQRLQEEAGRLKGKFPVRVHYTR
jgi:hypothetical protein